MVIGLQSSRAGIPYCSARSLAAGCRSSSLRSRLPACSLLRPPPHPKGFCAHQPPTAPSGWRYCCGCAGALQHRQATFPSKPCKTSATPTRQDGTACAGQGRPKDLHNALQEFLLCLREQRGTHKITSPSRRSKNIIQGRKTSQHLSQLRIRTGAMETNCLWASRKPPSSASTMHTTVAASADKREHCRRNTTQLAGRLGAAPGRGHLGVPAASQRFPNLHAQNKKQRRCQGPDNASGPPRPALLPYPRPHRLPAA